MKKVILLTILFLSVFVFSGCNFQKKQDTLEKIKELNTIKVGVKADSKPFGYFENGERKGFDIDIAREIARVIFNGEENIEFITVTPQSRIEDLNSGKVDILIATMSVNEKRRQIVDFSVPYFMAGQALMVKEGSKIQSVQDLNKNKKVAIIIGTTGEKTLRLLAPNAVLIGRKSYPEAFALLKNGEVEGLFGDDSILYGFDEIKGHKILQRRYTKEFYAVTLRKEKESESLKTLIDAIITNLNESGKLKQIKTKWI